MGTIVFAYSVYFFLFFFIRQEEIAAINLAKYRKLQHDLEEAEMRARLAEKNLNQQRSAVLAARAAAASTEDTVVTSITVSRLLDTLLNLVLIDVFLLVVERQLMISQRHYTHWGHVNSLSMIKTVQFIPFEIH